MPKKKKSEMKVTEIPSKIKEVKEVKEVDESELEKEVDELDFSDTENVGFAPSGRFQAPILSSGENAQQVEDQPVTAEQRRDEPEFSQTRMYSSQPVATQERARYVSPEDAMRRVNPSLTQTNVNFNPMRRSEEFSPGELAQLRNENIEKQDLIQDRPDVNKRKYTWER
ncbi:MAG: hypothetical protein AABX85_03525 [Nanoarchaeota archaeon]